MDVDSALVDGLVVDRPGGEHAQHAVQKSGGEVILKEQRASDINFKAGHWGFDVLLCTRSKSYFQTL